MSCPSSFITQARSNTQQCLDKERFEYLTNSRDVTRQRIASSRFGAITSISKKVWSQYRDIVMEKILEESKKGNSCCTIEIPQMWFEHLRIDDVKDVVVWEFLDESSPLFGLDYYDCKERDSPKVYIFTFKWYR